MEEEIKETTEPEKGENDSETEEEIIAPAESSKISHLKERLRQYFSDPKKRLVAIAVVGLLIVALTATGFYFLTNEKGATGVGESKRAEQNKPEKLVTALLDGRMVSEEAANRHPLAIVIENHPDARPQAGLDKASLVYEAIVEGGITRFLALYGSEEADKVGPVRSARTFFVDWSQGFNAFFSHVGGNIDALDQIKAEKILDLDQFSYSTPYWRERNTNLATEHTMYTTTAKLRAQASKNNYSSANNFNVLKFKDEPSAEEKAKLPQSQKITIPFSTASYEVSYQYDREKNLYKRFLAGSPHFDQITKKQLEAKDIVIMTVQRKPTVTRINESGWEMTVIGQGKAQIFLDGKMINGSWKKNSKTDRELFYDENGAEITFNRGPLWLEIIPPEINAGVE